MTRVTEAPALPPDLLVNARLLPDRDALLPLLPKGRVIVEVGVGLGDFSRKIVDACEPSHFVAIDIFRIHEYPSLWGRPTCEIFGGRTHGAFYRERFADLIAAGRMTVLEADSFEALHSLDNQSVDVVYVDADHSYDSVRRELSVIHHKVKHDGWIIMNDYTMADVVGDMEPYGVIHATNEFMRAEAWEMAYFALQNCMYCDVALRRRGADRDAPTPRMERLERENAALRSAIEEIRASTSWRVSAPLRAVGRMLGRA